MNTVLEQGTNQRSSRKATKSLPRYVVGIDVGNHSTYAYSAKTDSKGCVPEGTEYSEKCTDSWVYEHTGSLATLNAVSGVNGTTLRYLSGNPEFVDRIFVCGQSALLTRGATSATLIGDSRGHKVRYGLPMLLHTLVTTTTEQEFEAVVVGSIHDMNLAPDLKQSCMGKHTFEVLRSLDTGEIESTLITANIEKLVVQEGRSSLWYLSGCGDLSKEYPVDFNAVNYVLDGGGGTVDCLGMEAGQKLTISSVPIGGNNMIDIVLNSPTFRSRFPANVYLDRSLIAKAVKDGTWTYKSGNGEVSVNFSDEGLHAIEQLLPAWTNLFEKAIEGRQSLIQKVVLTGGLFLTKYNGDSDNEDETLRDPWSLEDLFTRLYDFKFVTHEKAAGLNALGSAYLAADVSAKRGMPLVVGKF